MLFVVGSLTLGAGVVTPRRSELLSHEEQMRMGIQIRGNATKGLNSHDLLPSVGLPDAFTWGDVNGTSYLTPSLNQHIPQVCRRAHGLLLRSGPPGATVLSLSLQPIWSTVLSLQPI